jgi:hypothetical protein
VTSTDKYRSVTLKKLPTIFLQIHKLFMSSSTPENKNVQNSSAKDETVDVRDLNYKAGYSKDPREVIENPAVTPQIPEESSDSSVGMDKSDRPENA